MRSRIGDAGSVILGIDQPRSVPVAERQVVQTGTFYMSGINRESDSFLVHSERKRFEMTMSHGDMDAR